MAIILLNGCWFLAGGVRGPEPVYTAWRLQLSMQQRAKCLQVIVVIQNTQSAVTWNFTSPPQCSTQVRLVCFSVTAKTPILKE